MVAGSLLGVVGVPFDATLGVRALPGPDETVVGRLDPLARDIVATGRTQLIEPGDAYHEITADGVTGWASTDHLLFIAGPTDVTDLALSQLGALPSAPSMDELGRIVVDQFAQVPDSPARVLVVVAAPSGGRTDEITFDQFFVGEEFGGDSVAGGRYRVVGAQISDDPDTVYELVKVELVPLCKRGADPDGLCV